MGVWRMREYASGYPHNPNVPKHKIEATTEHMAQIDASYEVRPGFEKTQWIYFYAELGAL